ncbi:substrate-binding periplasmic protein [Duganella aceris]|uniref:ABC transporter substrate-binding protein n=1 Tax=Duganella aceris TaxID=2703883 RepID=A0ABX0FRU5_9BURK|nr:ABC transporter substrate-binding protein [Duganella aceris]NGZ87064.1 ABC transporter substrate-binding protein [Duganella aceris]
MGALTRLRAVACLLLLASAAVAHGEPVVYVDGVDPMAYSENGKQQGLLFELLSEMAQRVHHAGPIAPMPLKRQRVLLRSRHDAIGTLWRFPEMEGQYIWWVKLFDSSFYMVAAGGSTVDISSVEAALDMRVGVILGSPAELFARRAGFRNIQTSVSAESNARKLALGRIDIWIATPRVLRAAQTRLGKVLAEPRVGGQIGKAGLYLVSSPEFDPREGEKWKAAFEAMQQDGSYARIVKKFDDAHAPAR